MTQCAAGASSSSFFIAAHTAGLSGTVVLAREADTAMANCTETRWIA
jgi:hypothetical protein